MRRYLVASVLALSLAGVAAPAWAQESANAQMILQELQKVRSMMYDMAQQDKSMMRGVKDIDKAIAMMQRHMRRSGARAR